MTFTANKLAGFQLVSRQNGDLRKTQASPAYKSRATAKGIINH